MKYECKENYIIELFPEGRIEASNADLNRDQIMKISEKYPESTFVIDADKLNYISSAGLRMILSLKKKGLLEKIINVQPDVYEILNMTGFTGLMTIEKKMQMQQYSEKMLISKDFYGKFYRPDPENIVRVYAGFTDIENVRRGVEYSKTALKCGINVALAYEPSYTGNQYSCKFSIGKQSRTLDELLKKDPEKKEHYLCRLAILLKSLHEDMKVEERPQDLDEEYCRQIRSLENGLTDDEKEKLCKIIKALPDANRLILKDFSMASIMMEEDQLYFTDLSMVYWGSPVLELTSMYLNGETAREKRDNDLFLHYYFFTEDEEELNSYRKVIGYIVPVIKMIREQAVLEQKNKKQLSKTVSEVRNQILQHYSEVIESINALNDHFENMVRSLMKIYSS